MIKGTSKLNWRDVDKALETYPDNLNSATIDGLMILLNSSIDYSSYSPVMLEKVFVEKEFFGLLVELNVDQTKIREIINTGWYLDLLKKAYKNSPSLASECIKKWDKFVWDRYKDDKRMTAMLSVGKFRMGKGQSAQDFATELIPSDELTSIFLEGGEQSLILCDALAPLGSGETQKKLANKAIDMLKMGYPYESLKDPESIELAYKCSFMPMFGIQVFQLFKQFGNAISFSVIITCLLIALSPILYVLYRIFRSRKSFKKGRREKSRNITTYQSRDNDELITDVNEIVDDQIKLPPSKD